MSQPSFIRRHLSSLVWIVIFFCAIILLLKNNATAREVTSQGLAVIFGFFTTPFILESTVAVIGFVILLQWNEWHRRNDRDEWVEMHVPDRTATESDNGNNSDAS